MTASVTNVGRPRRTRRLHPAPCDIAGTRRYLVAREVGGDGRMQHFRLDRIGQADVQSDGFQRDSGFDMNRHAACTFRSFHMTVSVGRSSDALPPPSPMLQTNSCITRTKP